MKQRFSSLDVKVIAQELSDALCSLRLSNVYDLSSRIFLFKFAKPDSRQSLVIDSGFKCYLTNFTRTTATSPSAFVSRLRKFLRSRRVTSISQVGTDRVIDIQFSDGKFRVFLEFFAQGNIILTDEDLSVLALFRTVSEGPGQEPLRVGLKYSLENRQNFHGVPALTRERIKQGLLAPLQNNEEDTSKSPKKGKRPKPGAALRNTIAATVTEFSPMLIDHALHSAKIDTTLSPASFGEDDAALDSFIKEAQTVVEAIVAPKPNQRKGYIIARPAKGIQPISINRADPMESVSKGILKYDDFQPFQPKQFTNQEDCFTIPVDGFNKTVDEFFSSVESQRLETRLTDKEESARRKLENTRLDHAKRIGGLQQVQELNERKAQAIEINLKRVNEAIAAVNSLISQGMDWQNVARLIKVEKSRRNVVAEMIKLPLKLYENTITLLLAEENIEIGADFEGDETDSEASDSESEQEITPKPTSELEDKRLSVDVDLSLSPYSNARQYYDQKKTAAVKELKTVQSSAKALKSAERKVGSDLKKELQQEKDLMRPQRHAFWFEKFAYFISSEGYLVLGGKDLQQSEILYNRHLKRGDAYIHADLQGAASIIVKNKPGKPNDPIPPSTLSQAGTLAVATSAAWDSKAVMSAWWVHADQISKTTPHGDFLQPGNFHVKGEKNFLPPAQLLLGFAVVFKISDESKARHLKHRVQDLSSADAQEHTAGIETQAAQSEVNDDVNEQYAETDGDGGGIVEKESNEPLSDNAETDDPQLQADEDGEEGSETDVVNPLQPNGPQEPDIHGHDEANVAEEGEDHTVSEEQGSDSDDSADVDPAPDDETLARELGVANDRPFDSEGPSNSGQDAKSSIPPLFSDNSAAAKKDQQKTPQSNVRGKHGKRQKQKTKYAHQDEEDRALAMKLLGSAAAQERAKDDAEAKAAKEKEIAEQKERRRTQHAKAAKRGKEAEEARRRRFEAGEDGDDEDEESKETAVDLDSFVGAPLPGDEILDALVICGPWDAIGTRCRWRAKLQPGTTKKGKAVKEVLTRWNALAAETDKKKRPGAGEGNETMMEEEKIRKREAELIKGIRDVEVVGVVPVGKVRVILGGADKGAKGGGKGKGGGRGGKGGKRK